MANAFSTALSGLNAAQLALSVSASNVANASSDGALPQSGASQGATNAQQAYTPQRVEQTFLSPAPPQNVASPTVSGGVATTIRALSPGFIAEYDPTASYADQQGEVAAPNVDLSEEVLTQTEASVSFKANLKTIQTTSQLLAKLYQADYESEPSQRSFFL